MAGPPGATPDRRSFTPLRRSGGQRQLSPPLRRAGVAGPAVSKVRTKDDPFWVHGCAEASMEALLQRYEFGGDGELVASHATDARKCWDLNAVVGRLSRPAASSMRGYANREPAPKRGRQVRGGRSGVRRCPLLSLPPSSLPIRAATAPRELSPHKTIRPAPAGRARL